MAQYKLYAKVRVKVLQEEGKYLLDEIHGLCEGAELVGDYTESNDCFSFKWNNQDACLWVGKNCELIEVEWLEYAVEGAKEYNEDGIRQYWNDEPISENWMDFETLQEAKKFVKQHGGSIVYGAGTICEDESSSKCRDYIIPCYWRDSMAKARKALRQAL